DGSIESRTVRNIMSDLWNATVVDIIPDGSQVKKGDILVRFDASNWEKDLPRLEREYTMARSDLDSLTNAKLPLELSDIGNRLNDARQKSSEETQALSDSRELLKEKLISEQEVKQQETKVTSAKALADSLQQQLELTRKYLHPSTIERAKATLASAEREFNNIKTHTSNCIVRAPANGMVIYKILPIGSEVRTIRVGDTVYKNQTFLTLPDMSNLIMRCDVPESDITRVRIGNKTKIQALAYPDLNFDGSVETVGAMAQSVAGRPSGRKYFSVVIRVDNPDDRLKSGMSARARILSYSKKDAVLIPRTAVWWERTQPFCNLQKSSYVIKTVLKIGMANETQFEVIEGVKPGDRVIVR
ncbi:MAG: efflux RND transporter periplasmic adaptor subunit, partial [Kiritimatiellae bacterium]|nr:efflux RND transporter periplasmic adaptor subunit [Kiritimatiellia bacterium]